MAKPVFGIFDQKSEIDGFDYRIVKYEIPGGITTPEEFDEAVAEIEHQLTGDLPILLWGRGPIWGYGYMIHAAHATPAIGTFDPRMKGYIIVASHDQRFRRGQLIPNPDPRESYEAMVIAVGGPPNSGKSVFINELYAQLLKQTSRVFKQVVCPEFAGQWEHETDPVLIARIRKKGEFSPGFMEYCRKSIQEIKSGAHQIILLDLGGEISAQNAEFLQLSTHLIVLSNDQEQLRQWQDFGIQEGCETLGLLNSKLVRLADKKTPDPLAHSQISINPKASLIKGELVNLERAAGNEAYQEALDQMAKYLVEKATHWITAEKYLTPK